MRVVKAKSDLVFTVQDLINETFHVMHGQRLVPYPITKNCTYISEELRFQADHFDKKCHLVEMITGVRKYKGSFEIKIRWTGYDHADDEKWEPISQKNEKIPGILENYLHTAGDRNLKREIINLYD